MTLDSSAFEIVAHRGASFSYPENTCVAAAQAWQEKADAVELDVHLSRDGHLVVIHDADTKRTAGKPGMIAQMDLSQIQALDNGRWKDVMYAGEKVPTLREMLAVGPEDRRFFVEIKCGPEAVPVLKACLSESKLAADQVVIISFDPEVVLLCKKELPAHQVLWLVGYGRNGFLGRYPSLDEVIAEAHRLGVDGLDLSQKWPIDADFVAKIKAAGLGVWVWTVDNVDKARSLKKTGVNGVTTNRPGWLRERM